MTVEQPNLFEIYARLAVTETEIRGLREQQKAHAQQQKEDNQQLQDKIDGIGDRLGVVTTYIEQRKAVNAAMIGIAATAGAFLAQIADWLFKGKMGGGA